jgi:hypothetical protein
LFTLVEEKPSVAISTNEDVVSIDLKELSVGEISAIYSSLAKGCEKQRLIAEGKSL